ncbi:MAG: DUF4105 domain-containing protein [Polyangiales bacterium]
MSLLLPRLLVAVSCVLWLAAIGCGQAPLVVVKGIGRHPVHAYAERWVERARAARLAEQPQWHKLLHYRLGVLGKGFLGGGYTSEADGPGFFLSPRGKVDPQAELDATIRGFFAPLSAASATGDPDDHPLCRFPARFMFLRAALGIDPRQLPVQRCPAAERFLAELDPGSLTLIFSSYYLNNPASAFGHTFMRVNKRHSLAVGERRELLDYGVDYSADVDTGNALIYAFKGLTGMFPGTFKRMPYYYKVREYNDYESRDLWEYELNLTDEQLGLLSAHLWELGHTYFQYYYLSENCSYHVLSLLEVANPALQLLDTLAAPVIPADTIKTLYRYPDLVRNVRFRPSLRRQFAARVRDFDAESQALVEALGADAEHPIPPTLDKTRTIAVLDAAADLIDVLYGHDLVHKTDSEAARHKQRLLERRAAILAPSLPLQLEPPTSERPELGHGSHRLGLGVAHAAGGFGASLDFRLALHDLADPIPGYPELNSIEFLRLRLQLWAAGPVTLQDASFVHIVSLNPQSRFDRKLSWEFDVGATTVDDKHCSRCAIAHVSGGAGMAFALFDQALTFFVLGYASFGWAPELAGLLDSHLRLGIGPSGGLRLRVAPGVIALGTARWLWLPGQSPQTTYRLDAELRVQVVGPLALGVIGRQAPQGLEAQALAYVYF